MSHISQTGGFQPGLECKQYEELTIDYRLLTYMTLMTNLTLTFLPFLTNTSIFYR